MEVFPDLFSVKHWRQTYTYERQEELLYSEEILNSLSTFYVCKIQYV